MVKGEIEGIIGSQPNHEKLRTADGKKKTGLASPDELLNAWRRQVKTREGEEAFFTKDAPPFVVSTLAYSGVYDAFRKALGVAESNKAIRERFGSLPDQFEEGMTLFLDFMTARKSSMTPTPDAMGNEEFEKLSSEHTGRKREQIIHGAHAVLERKIREASRGLVRSIGEDNFFSGDRNVGKRYRQYHEMQGWKIVDEETDDFQVTSVNQSGSRRTWSVQRGRDIVIPIKALNLEVLHRSLDIVNHTDSVKRDIKLPENFAYEGGTLRINGIETQLPVRDSYIMSFGPVLSAAMLLDHVNMSPEVKEAILAKALPRVKFEDGKLEAARPDGAQSFTYDPSRKKSGSGSDPELSGLYDEDLLIALFAVKRDQGIPDETKDQFRKAVIKADYRERPADHSRPMTVTAELPSGWKYMWQEHNPDPRQHYRIFSQAPGSYSWHVDQSEKGFFALREAFDMTGVPKGRLVPTEDNNSAFKFWSGSPFYLHGQTAEVDTKTMEIQTGIPKGEYSRADEKLIYLIAGLEDARPGTFFSKRREENVKNVVLNTVDIEVLPAIPTEN